MKIKVNKKKENKRQIHIYFKIEKYQWHIFDEVFFIRAQRKKKIYIHLYYIGILIK